MRYTTLLIPREGGGYMALVPYLPEVVTTGETVEEAMAMAKEATELALEVIADHGEPIPVEPAGVVVVEIEAAMPATALAG